jgi:hypothetical protein
LEIIVGSIADPSSVLLSIYSLVNRSLEMQLEDDEDRASISAMLKARERQEKEHQNYWRGPGG